MRGGEHAAELARTVLSTYLHAYSMLDMKVTGLCVRGVSMTKRRTVGKEDATMSVMMLPDADHVNTSIWPGVSMSTYLRLGARASSSSMTWSKRVANRFSAVTMAPLGPSPYCVITSL